MQREVKIDATEHAKSKDKFLELTYSPPENKNGVIQTLGNEQSAAVLRQPRIGESKAEALGIREAILP